MNIKLYRNFRLLAIIITFFIICSNMSIVAKASSDADVLLVNSKYNTTTACWDFTIQSNTKDKIYYSFNDNETMDNMCKYIKNKQVISIPSNMIENSYKTLRLFTLNKKNKIKNETFFEVNNIVRNIYMNDLTNLSNTIYDLNDTQYIKAKKLYTWIGENKKYNYDGNTNNKYGAFYGESSACSGFANLYVDLCNVAGIKCEYVNDGTVDYYYEEWHSWNHIYLDEKLYLVDVVWSGVCFDNKIDYSRFCNNGIVNHAITIKYNLSSCIYDNYIEYN